MRGTWIHWAALLAIFAGLAAMTTPNEALEQQASVTSARPGSVAFGNDPGSVASGNDADLANQAGAGEEAMAGDVTPEQIELGIAPGSGIARLSDAELAADLDLMVSIGVTWLRIDLPWSVIEAERGTLDWTSTDRLIDAATERGLLIDGLISYAPPWANGDAPSDKYPPNDSDDFAEFAAAAATRYAPLGVHTWELWNEPNIANFWAPSPDPDAYARLFEAGAAAIRSVDEQAFIITAGLSPAVDDPKTSLSPETFLIEMYQTLSPGVVDAVGIHPYSFPADPTDRSEGWNTYGRLPEMATLVSQLEGAELPLWFTEFGAPFDPDEPERQASIVGEGVACATRSTFPTGPVFVYALRDAIEPSDELPFGLIDADGSPRPSWAALSELLAEPRASLAERSCW